MNLVYLPLFIAFVLFVVYGGLVLPAREIADSVRRRPGARRGDSA